MSFLEPVYQCHAVRFNPRSQQCVQHCVVPENIQSPTTEGISLRTPPPPRIFHFCWELMPPPPHPSGISSSMTKTPQPLWKSSFSKKKKNGQYTTVSIRSLYASVSIYLGDLATLKHTTPPQSNLICNFCSTLTLSETDKVNKSVIFVNLPQSGQAYDLLFVFMGIMLIELTPFSAGMQNKSNFQPQN